MPQHVALRPGDPGVVGHYRLSSRIEGIPSEDPIFLGFGPDGTEVTISMIQGEWAHDVAARDRFAAEATVARRVPPFCAARILDAGADGLGAYLVSEYIPGPSLLEVVLASGPQHGPELISLAIGMATGLASIHLAGLVHGNFGPEYTILGPDGQPRVVEFGITPPYGTATPAADMLAWAHTVAFAATGHPPESLSELGGLPEPLRAIVTECLQPDAAERPAARAVVRRLLGTDDLPAGLLAEGSRRAAALASQGVRGSASRTARFAGGLTAGAVTTSQGAAGPAGYNPARHSPAATSPAGTADRSARPPPRRRGQAIPAPRGLARRSCRHRRRSRRRRRSVPDQRLPRHGLVRRPAVRAHRAGQHRHREPVPAAHTVAAPACPDGVRRHLERPRPAGAERHL